MCNHNICVYVEHRTFVDFYTEEEVLNEVKDSVYDEYLSYIDSNISTSIFSQIDYVDNYCEANRDTDFIPFDFCPDCGERLDWEAAKDRINNSIYEMVSSFAKERRKKKKREKKLEKEKNDCSQEVGFVYLVKLGEHYKIGISVTPKTRLKEFTLLPYPLEEIVICKVKGYKIAEQELHDTFSDKRVRGEWFSLSEDDICFIRNYLQERKID